MKCKITKSIIKPFMSFGKMPIANAFIDKNDFNKEFLLQPVVKVNRFPSFF